MNPLKKLFKQTFIYGLATVLPRVIAVVLLPLYTTVFKEASGYGEYVTIYSWIAIFNVVLAYGMETAFFRFYHEAKKKSTVTTTALLSIVGSSILFLTIALFTKGTLAQITGIKESYIGFTVAILLLDALVIIPFAWLRATERPMKYALLKIINVVVNLGGNIFFLIWLPNVIDAQPEHGLQSLYLANFEISYIFISNVFASGITLLMLSPLYWKVSYVFDTRLWKKMLQYAGPVLWAGIAFTINEVFDKILLAKLLPSDVAESQVGMYAACYKLALFMTLFATAFRMGIEPFFFSHSKSENPQRTYAQITNYFVVIGSVILLGVMVFADLLKQILIPNNIYWEAMEIVPIILLASFCLGIYHNLSVWYKVTDKTKYGAYISTVGAAVTLGVNFIFIPTYGYWASAWATLAAYGVMMLLSFYFGKRNYPIPYNYRKMCFYTSISLLLGVIAFYGFDRHLGVGIPLLLLFLGIVYRLERDNIKHLIQKE